nr:tumor necrosis factor receptor superfamily member 14 isoform X2 [Pelodiscus sinensis]|eukprot:XP_014429866.1 tumor necrosis factor receptor superfamily member 14 isoform X2 [Pelodiscus sinensis]
MLIFCIVLITQLPHPAALQCFPGEYEINGECCPMCSPGSRVVRHCKSNVSTTCIPCVHDTYTEHPNGLTECLRCKVCDKGARLTIKEKCTYTKNTVCGCALGDFCVHHGDGECEMCQLSTVCLPGSRVKVPGTEFSDNQCEVCPDGTFSASNMSRACQPWTKCEEQRMTEAKAGTRISDAVCQQSSLSGAVIAVIIILLVLLAASGAGGYFLWPKVKRKYNVTCKQGTEDEQKQAEPLKDNRAGTLPVQETVTENAKSSPGSI